MEIRQLEHFIAAAEEEHFSRAAERSNIVQSGLSASIRALEGELGTRLFDRTTRRVALTESGRALLPEARRVLAAATAAREAVAGVEGLTRGTLSIGIMQSLVAVRLPALLARFRALHPGVDIRLRQAGTTILLQEVRGGRLELAFASLPDPAPAGLVGHELLSEAMMLACSPAASAGRPSDGQPRRPPRRAVRRRASGLGDPHLERPRIPRRGHRAARRLRGQ